MSDIKPINFNKIEYIKILDENGNEVDKFKWDIVMDMEHLGEKLLIIQKRANGTNSRAANCAIFDVSNSLPGYVKIEDECYIEDCFDNNDNPIDGRFTEVYLKIDEVENGGKLKKQ